jgi:gluconolactonase
MHIEVAAEGLQFPEGPIAMDDGSVIVCEIRAGRLTRVAADGRKSTVAETGGGPNGAAIGPDGAIWVCNNGTAFQYLERDGVLLAGRTDPAHRGGALQRVDLSTGKVETVLDSYEGRRLIAPNDLVFDKAGGLWFTDHGGDGEGIRRLGALYYLEPGGGRLTRPRDSLFSPNGVGLSPDEAVVYMADSHMGRVWAFDLSGPGKVASTRGRGPGRVLVNLPGYQPLDSLAVEADGRVAVATIQTGAVTSVAPDGSFEQHAFPDVMTTNICFGGPDMRTAWITGSSTGKLFKVRWPRAGLRLNFNA